ncbi:sugar kinase [Thermomicrobium sp. 4228-Ro]|uniref:sugar kinase n=1 Tax=Thermomicrobium sp. 4228-Ro TaxID=2993937 RepID=UPI002248DED5|nr:sugar kinase [Thermomicrobium sp. 4228-Ro]MCX2727870.1 sugar kinase [Thermomicrobium sp. 4228-Ro]
MRWDVVGFGEAMLRLAVPTGERLETTKQLEVGIGGAEANVLIALARLGRRTAWSSVLPRNTLGERIARELAWHGVDTSLIHWTDEGRVGVYFLDVGVPPRPTVVLYDRAGSVVAHVDPLVFPVEWVSESRWLHATGITPALSSGCRAVLARLVERACQSGVGVSFDVNYRSRLWSPEEAARTLEWFCRQATVLLCGEDDARLLWGLSGDGEAVAHALSTRFGAAMTVVTRGEHGAVATTADGRTVIVPGRAATVVDRVGAGDAFAAGFLHGYLDTGDVERGLQYGVALAALKLTVRGDLAIVTAEELESAVAAARRTILR